MSVGIIHSTSYFLPSPYQHPDSRRAPLPSSNSSIKRPALVRDFLPVNGLRTPPVDDMSTTFQPTLASYDSHAIHNYTGPVSRAKVALTESRSAQYYSYPSQQTQPRHVVSSTQPLNSSFSAIPQATAPVAQPMKAPTPESSKPSKVVPQPEVSSRRGSETLVYHSLEIPKCISPNRGNLADFAAQMTCLFWFESMDELKQAESVRLRPLSAPVPRLPSLAKPHDQFRKWVNSVLSTTQVTQNVILLALLFIYRLRMSTPQIKGRGGSEYRLLTVALMLGNKFLDDNTYTNKTWAEVSSFAVQEIHVMEVEFLSNMRYNLVATKAQWQDWLDKLACFHEYYERALRSPASPVHIPSPTGKAYHSPIPSPTASSRPHASTLPVTPAVTAMKYSPSSSHSQNWSAHQMNAVSPLAAKPSVPPVSRKRALEEEPLEHPAKRPAPVRPTQAASGPTTTRPGVSAEASRLSVPHLTLVTDQSGASGFIHGNGYPQVPLQTTLTPGSVSLPPLPAPVLQHGLRAMATVFPPAPSTMVQQPSIPATTSAPIPPAAYTGPAVTNHAPMSYATPSKHHSPGTLGPYTSSPLADQYSAAPSIPTTAVHTPISNSPSVYLQQRPSPYKPVRHVNTLLYPPPSASLDQYHLSVPIPPTQMHYQPLGRRNDLRTGILPEFVIYNRQQQHSTPIHGLSQGHYQS